MPTSPLLTFDRLLLLAVLIFPTIAWPQNPGADAAVSSQAVATQPDVPKRADGVSPPSPATPATQTPPPTPADVQILDPRLDPDRRAWYRSHRVGFVFQAFNLLPRLTVVENVALPLLYRDNSDPEANLAAARVALERVGMSHRLDHRPTQLSGGERQRVAVARAIVGTPSIIFADEPTGNLDVKNVDRVLELLGSLIKEGITVVLVTHDLSVAERAHRVISMRAGLVQEDRVR